MLLLYLEQQNFVLLCGMYASAHTWTLVKNRRYTYLILARASAEDAYPYSISPPLAYTIS